MTDLWLLTPIVTLSQNPMRELKLPPKRVTGPLKLQPEVAYSPWEDRAKELLVEEMRNRKLGYKELARLLEPYGIDETPDQINRKVNRKRFSAAFLLACLAAMGVESVSVPAQLGAPKTHST